MTADLFKNSTKTGQRCCHSHPVLKLGMGEVVGASCGSPRDGYDIYIGLCYTMKLQHQPYPWNMVTDPVIEFQYNITDGCAPKDVKEFKKMIDWVTDQLNEGKRIHVGCIGGHGRTGTFLAALVSNFKVALDTDDPIQWVRDNHCQKAVESESQVNFLHKHFGCKKHAGSKEFSGTITGRLYGKGPYHWDEYEKSGSGRYRKPKATKPTNVKVNFMGGKGSIWGD